MKNEHLSDKTENAEDFAKMLEESYREPARLRPGQSITARIVKITSEWALLDAGGKGEGYLDKKELMDAAGNLTVKEGDKIRAWFLFPEDGEMRFTSKIGSGPSARLQLAEAMRAKEQVEGAVASETKGGFEIVLSGGARAFCPFSHMGMRRGGKSEDYIGRTLMFEIAECGARNVVVSRRGIVEHERREKIRALKNTLEEGMRVKGVVTSAQKFGAFVDLGGVEGLIPASEISWDRSENVSDRLSPGQAVEVAIKKLDWENEKISLSLRDILPNPWDNAERNWPPGSYHTGKITRIASFGAFVMLGEGVEGLIHVSRLGADGRIKHPAPALAAGQAIDVKVESVDRENRKISLIPAASARARDEDEAAVKKYRTSDSPEPQSLGALGETLKKQLEKKAQGGL